MKSNIDVRDAVSQRSELEIKKLNEEMLHYIQKYRGEYMGQGADNGMFVLKNRSGSQDLRL